MFKRFATGSKLIITAFLAVIALCLYGGLFYVTNYIQQMSVDIGARKAQVTLDILRSQKAANVVADTAPQQAKVASYVLTGEGVVAFIENIEGLGRQIGITVTIDNVTTAPYPGVTGNWEALSAAISTSGDWKGTYQFLSAIEHLSYRTSLTRVVIQEVPGDKTHPDSWNGDFTLLVLKRK